jgi:subtilisin family serine protease
MERARSPFGRTPALRRVLAFAVGSSAFALPLRLEAALDLGALLRGAVESRALPRPVGARVGVVTEVPAGGARPAGFVAISTLRSGAELGVLETTEARLSLLVAEHPALRFDWSPPLRALLDRADGWLRASSFRNATGLTGRGVVVGIIDTGMDPTHPDLRDENGATRVRYWLDFSMNRAELHPDLEDELGCGNEADGRTPCAVLDGGDVTELLENDEPGDDPRDPVGHGTHVASLAAGNGFSQRPPRYVGVAPEASLIVARVLRRDGGIYDVDVLKAARFVFARAAELGMPAVVNLSLGSDFGGHDGTSPIERGLAGLVGTEHPGRAIVVAAGNSAGLYEGLGTGAPEPLGVHTDVHVPGGTNALIPIITPVSASGVTNGTIYAWVGTRPGDELAVGVDDTSGTVLEPVPLGAQAVTERGEVEVVVVNGASNAGSPVPEGASGAVVMLDGRFPSGVVFGLRLEGAGSANVWVQGEGGFHPDVSFGPLVPRATKDSTVNVPASSPALIAVGATLNRNEWIDVNGETVSFEAFGALEQAPLDTTSYFSSAGPNALGGLKPDLVAPGAFVVGAMAANADPRDAGASGMFAGGAQCAAAGLAATCLLTDDFHAVSSGTSMAAPLVTGAIALLFQRDPSLDQDEVRALLQSGARRPEGVVLDEQQVGAGGLDLERTLEALEAGDAGRSPGAGSALVLSQSFVHPDPAWPFEGLVQARDDAGRVADGFDESRLVVEVLGGSVRERLVRLAPGLYRFSAAAESGGGGRDLTVTLRFDGRVLVQKTLPIAVDSALATALPSARGGCSLAKGSRGALWPAWFGLAALAWLRARRSTRAPRGARTGRRPDRTAGSRRRVRCARRRR